MQQPINKSIQEDIVRAGLGTEPLTVICSLLSRADATPANERSRADGHVLDRSGSPLADPATDAHDNAFATAPHLHFEHWGEYWRKVHGARFLHLDEADDRSLDLLLRYDQLHRFAPGPTHTDAPPYRAPVDLDDRLWPTVIGYVAPYARPQWDGIAYLAFGSEEDIAPVLGSARFREKILPEDRVLFRDIAPILTRQYLIVPSSQGNEPVTLVKLHVRAAHIDRAAFQQWWLHEHASLVKGAAGERVRRYAQLHNIGPVGRGLPFQHPYGTLVDGVTLMSFDSVTELEAFLASPGQQDIARDEARMCDTAAGEWWTAIGMTVTSRLGAEQATSLPARP
jgi:hypothetical protein